MDIFSVEKFRRNARTYSGRGAVAIGGLTAGLFAFNEHVRDNHNLDSRAPELMHELDLNALYGASVTVGLFLIYLLARWSHRSHLKAHFDSSELY